jgi:hypothetical protein
MNERLDTIHRLKPADEFNTRHHRTTAADILHLSEADSGFTAQFGGDWLETHNSLHNQRIGNDTAGSTLERHVERT